MPGVRTAMARPVWWPAWHNTPATSVACPSEAPNHQDKWVEGKAGAEAKVARKKYWYSQHWRPRQKPDFIAAKADKQLAARFYQLKTGYRPAGQYLAWTKNRPTASDGGANARPRGESTCSRTAHWRA